MAVPLTLMSCCGGYCYPESLQPKKRGSDVMMRPYEHEWVSQQGCDDGSFAFVVVKSMD